MSLAANTILEQTGGSQALRLMIGAENFTSSANSLSFRFCAKAKNGIDGVLIVLDRDDTYTVMFLSGRGKHQRVHASFNGVYADSLRDLIEQETGLCLRVPRIIRGAS